MHSVVAAVLALVILISAVWVVTLRNLFRAALALGLSLIGVAGLFILLEAEFIAFVQILVYVGAILTLVVFAIMLTSKLHGDVETSNTRQPWPAAAASLGLFILLSAMTQSVSWPKASLSEPVQAAAIGQKFMTTL